jgi:hypothetical protein
MHFQVNRNVDMGATKSITALTSAADRATSSISQLGSGTSSLLSSVGSAANDATKGLGTFGSALNQFPSAPTGGGVSTGGGLFGWLGGLFGGGGGGGFLSPQASSALLTNDGLYDSGGYTGAGGIKQPAGIVHRGEVVWSQEDIARAGGVHVVEGMRRGYAGYAEGGYVKPRMMRSDPWGSRRTKPSNDPNANDNPNGGAQNIQQTNNFIFRENPAAPASQNQIAAKSARALERITRVS